ncbi:glutathione S-transferase family protein [Pseudoduganella violaceinigra]|uniref:glutathione S-transferase family protein n=1 Tax=Pseudoduganella violaceinigra TaxID=246602 RepID=UPI0004890967|nr:glutathione S-transferase family protein [Pseudoduganella violaceinigra]
MLKLIGKTTSINVRKVLWTLAETGLPYERLEWQPEHAALNPNGLVPVLVDGDFVLWESNSICRYLCGKAGRDDLLPAEPQARARVEQWMDWQATDLNASWRYAFMALVRQSPAFADSGQVAASADAWNRNVGILDRHLADGGPFAVGGQFTVADIVLGLSLNRWLMTPIGHPRFAAIEAYVELLLERPAYREFGRNGIA